LYITKLINIKEGLSMETIKIKDEYIKLGQAMKLAGLVSSGIEAKIVIQEGQVTVNGEVDTRRGKKLVPGDTFAYNGTEVTVE
jgi:ribosome-associated protein